MVWRGASAGRLVLSPTPVEAADAPAVRLFIPSRWEAKSPSFGESGLFIEVLPAGVAQRRAAGGRSPPIRSPHGFHPFVNRPAKEKGVGPGNVLDRVTMQLFVRDDCTMIAAPAQCDVDGSEGVALTLLKRSVSELTGGHRTGEAGDRTPVSIHWLGDIGRWPSP